MQRIPLALLACIIAAASIMAGCSSAPEQAAQAAAAPEAQFELRQIAVEPDPASAIEEIYASLEESDAESLDTEAVDEIIGVKASSMSEFYVYYSDPKSGLADIAIIKPDTSKRDDIRESLYQFKDRRMQEFENYNILNAHEIAQNAIVYDQGDYVILLMLADNEAAKAIIDQYIPQ